MDDVTTVQIPSLNQKQALERVISFAQRFGPPHMDLAWHAAFPLVLSPDLLYRIWASFLPQIPWTTVSDILLSPLCREVGYELYEMEPAIRNLLLRELKDDDRFGEPRLKELAGFLEAYIALNLESSDPDQQDLAEAQHLAALAYIAPREAAREIASKISDMSQLAGADLLRIATLTETLSPQLQEYSGLVSYARGVERLAHGDRQRGADLLERAFEGKQELEIAGVTLPRPQRKPENLQSQGGEDLREEVVSTPGVSKRLKVLLCHASGDRSAVHDLYESLMAEGIDTWLDQERLLPGQDWRVEIPQAAYDADVIVICLSNKSLTRQGSIQQEIKFVLDIAEGKPDGTIFLIPARLEDCPVPERLSRWQWVDLFEENGFARLLRSLKVRADRIGATVGYKSEDQATERRLDRLYTEGLAALYTEDWDRAYQCFQAILSERPDHKQAAEKLAQVEQKRNSASAQATEPQPRITRRSARPGPPRPPQHFIGRTEELERLRQMIQRRAKVVITGIDGIGKSTLLQQVANSEESHAMPDGVLWIGGAPTITLDDVVQQLFDSLYESDPFWKVPLANAQTYLSEIQALVIVDGLELPSSALQTLSDLLPRSALLVSSTRPHAGERFLDLPLSPLPAGDAIQLFMELAGPSYEDADISQIDSICRLLGSVPLAIAMTTSILRETRTSLELVYEVLAAAIPESREESAAGLERAYELASVLASEPAAAKTLRQRLAAAARDWEERRKLGQNPPGWGKDLLDQVPPYNDLSSLEREFLAASRAAARSQTQEQGPGMQNTKPAALPNDLVDAMQSAFIDVRERAVQDLASLLSSDDPGLARLAREALERMAKEDDSRRVSQAATQALEASRQASVRPRNTSPERTSESIGRSNAPQAAELLQKLKSDFQVDVRQDWGESDGVWQPGTWTMTDLERLQRTLVLMATLMGGNEAFIRNLGGVSVRKADIGTHGGEALSHQVSFSTRESFSAWTVVHQFAHAWDANYQWALSRELEKYTGGSTSTIRSLALRLTRNWDAGRNGPENKPGRYGRLPGCNQAGYFYGDKPSGSNWSFNRVEDFAESVTMYVGWERGNDLSIQARNRIVRYTLPNRTRDAFGVEDNWADYARYFYPESGDYTKTKRWQFIDDLVKGKIRKG